jgi:DNA-directed RNA polymerase specialized sigma24 family protein
MAKSHHYSDGELLLALRSGGSMDAPISYLYTAHFDNLTNFIRVNNGSQQDAEDVFQEMILVFIDLVRRGSLEMNRASRLFCTPLYVIYG